MAPTILVAGGSGYLGQFLVDRLGGGADGFTVAYTYHNSSPPPFATTPPPLAFQVDFVTGSGLDDCFAALGDSIAAVINCVAISQPAVCEKDPEHARALNVPTKLLDALESYKSRTGNAPLLIHLSTDQVYDGSRANWKEEDDSTGVPVNEYGRSKLAAELEILSRWPQHSVILRSSIIYGGAPPAQSVGRSLFLQFVDSALAAGQPTSFFEDEWRCPVYVEDICDLCSAFIKRATGGGDSRVVVTGVFNMGGPERLSRVDFARGVAKVRGYGEGAILSAPSASVSRGVCSPADISMDSTKIAVALPEVKMTPFSDALTQVFA